MYMKLHFTQWELKAWSYMRLDKQKELEELEWFPNGAVQSALCLILLKSDQCQCNTYILLWWQQYPKLCYSLIQSPIYPSICLPT